MTSLTFVSSDVKFLVDRCDSTALATHPCGHVGKRHVGLPKSEIEYQIHLSRYFRLPALRSASAPLGLPFLYIRRSCSERYSNT